MTPELRDLLMKEISDLKNRKFLSKNSDKQLERYEKLHVWRNSEENKTKNRETAMKSTARFTMDEVKEMRDRFYHGEPITMETLNEIFGNKVAIPNIKQILTNVSYKIDDWNYSDYEERKKQFKIVRDKKYGEDVLSGISAIDFEKKWGVDKCVYYRICKKIGYKRYGCNRPPM